MTDAGFLAEIERQVSRLPYEEQLWLIERLAHNLRQSPRSAPPVVVNDLAAMAADPDIQRELREIAAEFAGTEMDGLEED
jgi:hypothetical protein